MWAHNSSTPAPDELVTMFWTNELFDPDRPDTWPEAVATARPAPVAVGGVKIGLISQWYPPERRLHTGQPGAPRLAGRGHEVRVLTTFPNYPYGRVYPGWRQRWRHRETEGPVTVRRVPAYPSHDTSAVRPRR